MKHLTSLVADTDDGYVQAKVGLIRKRAALAGELEALNREVVQKTADMRAIEAALRVLDPGGDLASLPENRPLPAFAAFRGELARILLTALRNAPGGLTSKELTAAVLRERHMDGNDPAAQKLMLRRVNHALNNVRRKGLARSEKADITGMLRWTLA